ncbi:MAG TPA: hypothetical protein VMV49_06635 [Candidatus Deferrimicrobium sp.]|nr:hypothetical protein [Candidatus Deferrimicrobium sp.]
MSVQYFGKCLEVLQSKALLILQEDFVWQIFNRDGLPITEPYGPLEISEEMIYIFHRLIDIRDKIPYQAIIIQFLKDVFIMGVGEPTNFTRLFREIDKICQKLPNILPSEIPYKVFNYENIVQNENCKFPEDFDLDLVIREARQIDRACPRVYELFLGNIQKLAFLGMRHSTKNSQYSIITSSGRESFLEGMVKSDNLGSMFYLVQEYHPVIEKIYDSKGYVQ